MALRQELLTGRMNHAVQTLIASMDDPVRHVMPLDRMELQIRFLFESMDELNRLVEVEHEAAWSAATTSR